MICRIIICVSKFAFSKSSCCDMYSTMMHFILLYSSNLDRDPQGLPSSPWKIQSHGTCKIPYLAITFIPPQKSQFSLGSTLIKIIFFLSFSLSFIFIKLICNLLWFMLYEYLNDKKKELTPLPLLINTYHIKWRIGSN